jgi:osmotically-inducible protein OsmY
MEYRLDKINVNFISGLALALLLVSVSPFTYAQTSTSGDLQLSDNAMDAWIQGRLESAYIFNQHLNPFTIDVDVDNGIVALTGTVESDIDKDLAGEIAKGIDKVEKVNNYLEVVPGTRSKMINSSPDESDFKQFVIDASITATVLTKLIANNNTSVMELRVNTESGVVNLKGKVDSEQEKQLVEQIAKNSPNVRDVNNELTVTSM